jgi:hypothetical protein
MGENQILTIALAAAPTMITVLIGILVNNSRLGDMNLRLNDMNLRLNDMRAHMDARFSHVDARFDAMQSMWRSELRRVEEVLDARLKHLEDHL